MEDEQLEQIKALFREAQDTVYGNGAFDTMADQAEATGDINGAVAQLVAAVINSTIKDAGVTDTTILLGLGIMLISDMLDGLQKVGLTAEVDAIPEIINSAMQQVFDTNPEVAEATMNDPQMRAAIENGMGSDIMNQAKAGGDVAQGVLQGTVESQGGGV
ncbi:hypothetical protein DRQ25_14990 [Candidatus Fermentibacteria bacterium]|nr:MAG: hypothetical protein DRQ25_14990 [Candidatus Fermentibacteria bacterium]